ncbi:MAG: cytochrome c oxidase subunit II [Gemmataceae bacterium]|nr:cytochrome c oxidase subunit II [Gemmataceae bacterium]
MFAQVPLWPEQASTIAPRVDAVTSFLLALTTFFTILIFTLVIFFAIKYRRRAENEVPRPVAGSMRLELTWTIIPLLIVMVIFVWGTDVYFEMARPPENALEVYVVGKQWMWYTQHVSGQRQNQGLTVPIGRPVRLTMTSQDVIHNFSIPAFRVKMDVVPGMTTTLSFTPTRTGKFHLFCAEYCGTNHSRMVGWVTVLSQSDFQQWLDSPRADGSAADAGRKLFQKLLCVTCHNRDSQRAPSLEGIYRTERPLDDGKVAFADDEYYRQSILYPDKQVRAGFKPIMPSYKGQVNEVELLQLIAFLKALGPGQTPPRTEETGPPAVTPDPQPSSKKKQ